MQLVAVEQNKNKYFKLDESWYDAISQQDILKACIRTIFYSDINEGCSQMLMF